jgi:hypothetical protein
MAESGHALQRERGIAEVDQKRSTEDDVERPAKVLRCRLVDARADPAHRAANRLRQAPEPIAPLPVLLGTTSGGPVQLLNPRYVDGHDVRTTALHLQRPETIERPDVERALALEVGREAVPVHVGAVVEHPLGHQAGRQLDCVVPVLVGGERLQLGAIDGCACARSLVLRRHRGGIIAGLAHRTPRGRLPGVCSIEGMETVDGVLPAVEVGAHGGLYAGPRYESPLGLDEGLTEADRELCEAFARDGYLVLDDIGLDDFDAIAAEIRRDLDPIHESGFNRVQDAWSISDAAKSVATAPRILETLRTLYGREPIPFQTLHFHRGSQQATHTDAMHFHSVPRHFMCGLWVALEPVGADNGPLHYYPGSHMHPAFEYVDLGLDPSEPGSMRRYELLMAELADASGLAKETIALEPGNAIIWAAGLWHGGEPIADPDSTRRTQVTHYLFDGCVHYAPRLRDLRRNKMGYLHYRDIRTGQWRRPSFEGELVRLTVSDRIRLTAKELAYRFGVKQYVRTYSS